MYKVIENRKISENSYMIKVYAPLIITRFIPGQFVIIMCNSESEKIPLTIYDTDNEGNVYLIY